VDVVDHNHREVLHYQMTEHFRCQVVVGDDLAHLDARGDESAGPSDGGRQPPDVTRIRR
jgi:hypothetical protein